MIEKKDAVARSEAAREEKTRKAEELHVQRLHFVEVQIDQQINKASGDGERGAYLCWDSSYENAVRQVAKKYREYKIDIEVSPPDDGEDDRVRMTVQW